MAFFNRIRHAAFRYRGLTPIPFLLVATIFASPVLWGLYTGLLLLTGGELLRFRAVSIVGSETRTTRSPYGSRLVTTGPFGYLRNPMYAGNIMIYTGVGLMSMALFPWLQVAGLFFFITQYMLIISLEEEFLKSRFGRIYEEYSSRVNRFIPRFPAFSAEGTTGSDSKVGFRSEKRTLQAELLVVALFVGLYLSSRGQG